MLYCLPSIKINRVILKEKISMICNYIGFFLVEKRSDSWVLEKANNMNFFAFNAVRLCFTFTEASFIGFVFQKLTIS